MPYIPALSGMVHTGMTGITDAALRALKPGDKPYKLRVERGLYLHVMPNGSRLWRYRYSDGKTDHTISFGAYPAVTLADARRRAQTAQDDRLNGTDPAAAKRAALTLEQVALDWYDKQRPRWRETHAEYVLSSLRADIFPALGSRPVADISPPDVLRAVRQVEARSSDLARRMRQRLDAIFGYAIACGYARDNPASQIIHALAPMPPGGRMPAIVDIAEAREMLRRVEEAPAFPMVKAANRFLALTAVRLGEMRYMKWDEIDGDIWEISAPRMKMARPHRVPLSPAALDILSAVRPYSGREYVFTTSKGAPNRPIGDNSIGVLLNRAGYKGRHVPHGYRSLFSTYLNERGGVIGGQAVEKLVEHALAHAPDDRVAAAYNRGTLFEARRELMNLWADVILDGALPLAAALSGPRK